MMPQRDVTLDEARLRADATYRADKLALYGSDPNRWAWYLREHSHTCRICQRVVTHTGFDAVLAGDAAHTCCGSDVRQGT